MIEIFEFIKQNLGECIALLTALGFSSAGIYSVVKTVFRLFTKRKAEKKKADDLKMIILAVVSPLIDGLGTNMAETKSELTVVIQSLLNENAELKSLVKGLSCDTISYIQTVLNQKGNENVALQFEQAKSSLIANTDEIEKPKEIIAEIDKNSCDVKEVEIQQEIIESQKEISYA